MVLWLRWSPANIFLPIYHLQKIQMPKGEVGWPTGFRCLLYDQSTRHLEWISHKDYTCWAKCSFAKENWNAVSKRRGNGYWAGKNNRCPLQQVYLVLWWAKRPETMQGYKHLSLTHTHTQFCVSSERKPISSDWLYFPLILFLLFRTMPSCLPSHSFCPVWIESAKCTILPHSCYWINIKWCQRQRIIMHIFDKNCSKLPCIIFSWGKNGSMSVKQWSTLPIFYPEDTSYIFPLMKSFLESRI